MQRLENPTHELAINGYIKGHKFNEEELTKSGTLNDIRSFISDYFIPIQSVNKDNSSYGLKHIVEKNIGRYVAIGELIYAMHLNGFHVFRETGSVNCHFNLSKKNLKGLQMLGKSRVY